MSSDWLDSREVRQFIRDCTGCVDFSAPQRVQSLWSGYGEIRRLQLTYGQEGGTSPKSIVAKWIDPPEAPVHPRGWGSDMSHQRKLESYRVESNWYQDYAGQCTAECVVPVCLGQSSFDDATLLLLSDLDTHYPERYSRLNRAGVTSGLHWLAHFHARFLGTAPNGLWPTGTYWQLQTRPDEFDVMADGELKQAASWLHEKLESCAYKTLVHGDAKVTNFCFESSGDGVAAVDFQYVGAGVGIRDVVYFLGSCLDETELADNDSEYLDIYFNELDKALRYHQPEVQASRACECWRDLYAVAWTDFYRFLSGWMPDHPKTHAYTRKLADQALTEFSNSSVDSGAFPSNIKR